MAIRPAGHFRRFAFVRQGIARTPDRGETRYLPPPTLALLLTLRFISDFSSDPGENVTVN
jgi:hypothetical protein